MRSSISRDLRCVAVLVLGVAGANVHSEPSAPFTGYVALLSNYVGRGLAQSVGEPAFQAELEYDAGNGIYAGVSATSINWIDQLYPGSSVSIEVDGWLGYRRQFARDWTFKGGVLQLQFPGQYAPGVTPPDTTELFASIGWRTLSARMNYTITDSFGKPGSRGSWYLDLSGSLPLGESWTAAAHLGRNQPRGRDPASGLPNDRSSYTDYKLALTRHLQHGMRVDLGYTWTNADPSLYTLGDYNVAGHHLYLALRKDF
ncbi:MAG TPA: TorF family putative porin [Gammaproteobacteria bacterium]